MKTVGLMGIKIAVASRDELLKQIFNFLETEGTKQISTVNPEFLLLAEKDFFFKKTLEQVDLVLPDGFGLVLMAFFKKVKLTRLSGADLVPLLLRRAEQDKFKVAIINRADSLSTNDDINKALIKEFPQLDFKVFVVDEKGSLDLDYDGYNPVVSFIALGAPQQEKLAAQLKEKGGELKIVMGVGGSFDFITNRIKRAPKILRRLGFEWLWRLSMEPVFRFKRIFKAVIVFPLTCFKYEFINRHFYRPNVVGFIVNRINKVLIVNSNKEPGRDFWKLPQGGRDFLESSKAAFKREMREELNINGLKIIGFKKNAYRYVWSEGYSIKGFKGQKQTLFIARLLNYQPIVLDEENKDFAWVKVDDLLEAVDPIVRPAYKIFLEEYKKIRYE